MTRTPALRFAAVNIVDWSDASRFRQDTNVDGKRHYNIELTSDQLKSDQDKTGGQLTLNYEPLGFSALLRGWSSRLFEDRQVPTPREIRIGLLNVFNSLEAQLRPKKTGKLTLLAKAGQSVASTLTLGVIPAPTYPVTKPKMVDIAPDGGKALQRFLEIKPDLVRAIRENPIVHNQFIQYEGNGELWMESWTNDRLRGISRWNGLEGHWDNVFQPDKTMVRAYELKKESLTKGRVDQTISLRDYPDPVQRAFARQFEGYDDPRRTLYSHPDDIFYDN